MHKKIAKEILKAICIIYQRSFALILQTCDEKTKGNANSLRTKC